MQYATKARKMRHLQLTCYCEAHSAAKQAIIEA